VMVMVMVMVVVVVVMVVVVVLCVYVCVCVREREREGEREGWLHAWRLVRAIGGVGKCWEICCGWDDAQELASRARTRQSPATGTQQAIQVYIEHAALSCQGGQGGLTVRVAVGVSQGWCSGSGPGKELHWPSDWCRSVHSYSVSGTRCGIGNFVPCSFGIIHRISGGQSPC
jgi:hypothetical protein